MKTLNRIRWLVTSSLLTLPVLVLASNGDEGPIGGRRETVALEGPITADNVAEILEKIIDALLIIVTPIAIIMTIWAGFLFMTAGGSEEKVKTARHTLLYVVIGVAILILSRGAVSLVESILK